MISKDVPSSFKVGLALAMNSFSESDGLEKLEMLFSIYKSVPQPSLDEMGVYGNVWIRKFYYANVGDNHAGHKHHHDHVSLLVKGSVALEVEGNTTVFHAPTFVTISKDKHHKITALTAGVIWYCIFALRDEHGDVTDFYSGDNSPYGHTMI